jgi:hypothetical protein
MSDADHAMGELLARIVKQCVKEGDPVKLDGLGTFDEDDSENLRFIADSAPSIFIAYVSEDAELALRLHDDLAAVGLRPWIDKRRLMPGQNWQRAIQRAVECSDFFIGCFSGTAVRKRGQFPHELRLALRCADRMPLEDNFIIPVRFEPCHIPRRIQSAIQHVDLFLDWKLGMSRLISAVWSEFGKRMNRY